MAEINANIVVEPYDITIQQETSDINITPSAIEMNIYTGGFATAAGNPGEVQYNNGGILGADSNFVYNDGTSTLFVDNITVGGNTDLGSINDITITGGSNGFALITDGSGNLSFGNVQNSNYAAYAGNIINSAQPNITSVGNLTSLNVAGNVTANYFIGNGALLTGIDTSQISNGNSNVKVFANSNITLNVGGNANILTITSNGINVAGYSNVGDAGNIKILGGNNGQYLQTDGAGNLVWADGATPTGNGTVGGSNTQIQFNDGGSNFGGAPGFTFNKVSNLFSTPGNANVGNNINVVGNVNANIFNGNGSGITGIWTLSNGTSNLKVFSNSFVAISTGGTSNIFVFDSTGSNTSSNLSITGTTKIQQATEKVNIVASGASGTINYDLLNGAILYYTSNASANFTLNLRGNSTTTLNNVMSTNTSMTCTFINRTGANSYFAEFIQIDGITTPVYWINALYPNINVISNSLSIYNFNIIKTASSTYTLIGSIIPGLT